MTTRSDTMTDRTPTTAQYAKARRRFHEDRRDPNRPPTRTYRRVGASPPPLAGHLTLDGIAEAMGLTSCAVYFRMRRGTMPFPIVKRAGHLYARVDDVAPHAVDAIANAHYFARGSTKESNRQNPLPDDVSARTGEMEAA